MVSGSFISQSSLQRGRYKYSASNGAKPEKPTKDYFFSLMSKA
jgi:hypothetical protein